MKTLTICPACYQATIPVSIIDDVDGEPIVKFSSCKECGFTAKKEDVDDFFSNRVCNLKDIK